MTSQPISLIRGQGHTATIRIELSGSSLDLATASAATFTARPSEYSPVAKITKTLGAGVTAGVAGLATVALTTGDTAELDISNSYSWMLTATVGDVEHIVARGVLTAIGAPQQFPDEGGTSGPITTSSITDAGTAGIAVLQSETPAQGRTALVQNFGRTNASVSAAGNTDLSLVAGDERRQFGIAVAAGAEAYTHTLTILGTNVESGCWITIEVSLAASANPLIEIRNLTSGGTLLGTAIGTGDARMVVYTLFFDGTNWQVRAKSPANVTATEAGLAIRRRTLSGNLVLGENDKSCQRIVPDADRDVTLPTEGAIPWVFLISHAGASYNLTVKRAGGTVVATLVPGSPVQVGWDGTAFGAC